jgi:hypothetical protein
MLTANYIAYWSPNNWYSFGNSKIADFNNQITTLYYNATNNSLYAGGNFTFVTNIGSSALSCSYLASCSIGSLENGWTNSPSLPGPQYYSGNTVGNGVNSPVLSIKTDSSNNIIVGGTHSVSYENQSAIVSKYISYYKDLTYTWDPLTQITLPYGVNGTVNAVAYDGNDLIYAAGTFNSAGGLLCNNIAIYIIGKQQWRPLIDNVTCETGVGGIVNALYYNTSNNTLYVGGSFTTAGGLSASNVAIWDANSETWSTFSGSGPTGTVYALEYVPVQGLQGLLYVGGLFTSITSGPSVGYIAYWDIALNTWNALPGLGSGNGTNHQVNAIKFYYANNLLFVGGVFTFVDAGGVPSIAANYIATWDYGSNTWADIGGTNNIVRALEYCPSSSGAGADYMLVGGDFTLVNALSTSANYIATYDVSSATWNPLGANDVNAAVYSISYESVSKFVYFGGGFTQMTTTTSSIPVQVYCVASADPSNSFKFTALPFGSDGTAANGNSGPVYAVSAVYSNSSGVPLITVGGGFQYTYEEEIFPKSYKQKAHNIAYTTNTYNPYYWNTMSSPIPQLNSLVKSVAYYVNDIYVGGEFTTLLNTPLNRIARWNVLDQLWYPILSSQTSPVTDNNGLNDIIIGWSK